MTESEFAVWLAVRAGVVAAAIALFVGFMRWAEGRGYVYGTRNKPKPGGV